MDTLFAVAIAAVSFLLGIQHASAELENSDLRLICRPLLFLLIAGLLLLGIRSGNSVYYVAGILSPFCYLAGYYGAGR